MIEQKKIILKVENLNKSFHKPLTIRNLIKKFFSNRYKLELENKVLSNISFELYEGEILGVVGESGSGKSTLAKVLIGLYEPDLGHLYINPEISIPDNPSNNKVVSSIYPNNNNFNNKILNENQTIISKNKSINVHTQIQMIFQDPYSSLNPKMTIREILYEPLEIHNLYPRKDWDTVISNLLQEVGLEPETTLKKYPAEFSGGQRQRICICRALLLNPKIIIADEPVSALDVSIQAQILELFKKINTSRNISFIFISHDLAVVKQISDRIIVIYKGNIVEILPSKCLLLDPTHPYTLSLLYSALKLRSILTADINTELLEKAEKAYNLLTNIRLNKQDEILYKQQLVEVHNNHLVRHFSYE